MKVKLYAELRSKNQTGARDLFFYEKLASISNCDTRYDQSTAIYRATTDETWV